MRNPRILIVEDQPMISMMMANILEVLDRDVAGTAETVSEALDLIESTAVDGAILDLNLAEGETSEPVALELDRRGIPFILASGGGIEAEAEIFHGRPKLLKPFTLSDMENVLDMLNS